MSEIIGTAFVDVRPRVADFRNETEAGVKSQLGTKPVVIPGQLQMSGLEDVKRDAAGIADATARAATSTTRLTASTKAETAAVRELTTMESLLERTRLRSRRATSVGPLRVAGIGLGVGTALFAATQALGTFATALEVTDGATGSTSAKLRNFGANVLRGNVIGAVQALGDETKAYGEAQIIAIQSLPQFASLLKEVGNSAEFTEAKLAAVTQLAATPQQFKTRAAAIDLEGGSDEEALRNLEAQEQNNIEREKRIRALGGGGMLAALEVVFKERKAIQDEAAKIRDVDALAPLQEKVTSARLAGGTGGIVAALEAERAVLQDLIAASSTDADKRRGFKAELLSVNQEIESAQQGVVDEQKRHQEAMLSARLDPFAERVVDATLAGGNISGALSAQAAEIQAVLGSKNLSRDQRLELKNQLVSINSQIESIQAEIVAEEQRHADEMEAAREAAHQAMLDGLGLQEQELRTAQLAAQLTKSTADDKARLAALIAFYRQAAANQNLSRSESLNFQQSLIGAQIELKRMNESEKQAAKEEKKRRADQRKRDAEARKDAQAAKKDAKATNVERSSFEELAFSFLQEQQGFASRQASNLLPQGTQVQGPDLGGGGRPRGGRATRISPFLLDNDNLPPAVAAEREREQNRPMTALQGTAVIHELRSMRGKLGEIRQDSGHPEARTRRIQARTAVETGVD